MPSADEVYNRLVRDFGRQAADAYHFLCGHESALQPTRQGYVGRVVIEAYALPCPPGTTGSRLQSPDDYDVSFLPTGPGMLFTPPNSPAARIQHAEEIQRVAGILNEARDRIKKGRLGASPLIAAARNASPAGTSPELVSAFAGRVVVESWAGNEVGVAVETVGAMDDAAQLRFSADCIDKAIARLGSKIERLKSGRAH